MNENLEKLSRLAAEIFGTDHREISEESSPKSLSKWDSLGHLQFILEIEDAFQVRFDSVEIPKLKSIGAILQEIEKCKKEPS